MRTIHPKVRKVRISMPTVGGGPRRAEERGRQPALTWVEWKVCFGAEKRESVNRESIIGEGPKAQNHDN